MRKIRLVISLLIILSALIFNNGCGNKEEEERKRRLEEEAKKEELRLAREAEKARELARKLAEEKKAKELEEARRLELARKAEEEKARKLAAEEEKKRQFEQRKEEILENISKLLISGRKKAALSTFNNFSDAKSYPEIEKILSELINANTMIISSFKKDEGQNLTLNLKGKSVKLTIKAVEKNKVCYEFKDGKVLSRKKFSIKDLSASEQIKRLADISKPARELYLGLNALKRKNYEDARTAFREAGIFSEPMLEALYPIQAKAELEAFEKEDNKLAKKDYDDQSKNAGDDNSKFKPSLISTKVIVKKSKKNEDGAEGKKMIVRTRFIVENKSSLHFTGLSVTVKLIGRHVVDKKKYSVINEYTHKINLSQRKKITSKEKQFEASYVDSGRSQHGFKYYGYMFIVKDPYGKVVISKGSSSQINRMSKAIIDSQEFEEFDNKGKKYSDDKCDS